MATPPTIHAAMTGPTPNNSSLIALRTRPRRPRPARTRSTTATKEAPPVGRRARRVRPPSTQRRAKYRTTTARIAPAWIVIAYVSAASLVASVVADVEQVLGDEQVAGRGDRQVLGDAFDDAEHDRLHRCQLVGRRARRGRRDEQHDQDPDYGQHAASGGASASVNTPFAAANASPRASSSVTRRVTPAVPDAVRSSVSAASTASTRAAARDEGLPPRPRRRARVERDEHVDDRAGGGRRPSAGLDPHCRGTRRNEAVETVAVGSARDVAREDDTALEDGHRDDVPDASPTAQRRRRAGSPTS